MTAIWILSLDIFIENFYLSGFTRSSNFPDLLHILEKRISESTSLCSFNTFRTRIRVTKKYLSGLQIIVAVLEIEIKSYQICGPSLPYTYVVSNRMFQFPNGCSPKPTLLNKAPICSDLFRKSMISVERNYIKTNCRALRCRFRQPLMQWFAGNNMFCLHSAVMRNNTPMTTTKSNLETRRIILDHWDVRARQVLSFRSIAYFPAFPS